MILGCAYLVKIRLQEMHFRFIFKQSRPVFLLEFFLPQDNLDVSCGVINLALIDVDLGEELKLQVVRRLLRIRGACEVQASRLEIKLHCFVGHIGYGDCEVDIVFGGIGAGGALRPQD